MGSNRTQHRRKMALLCFLAAIAMVGLMVRLGYLMLCRSEHYSRMAEDLHERERTIKAARGRILDANGVVIATNRTVCTISVIYNQVKDREGVIRVLCRELGLEEEGVRKKVEKRSSREIIRTNVDKEVGDRIRDYHLPGAKVISGGNIIVLGALKGNAHAGAYGNQQCFIVALEMEPIQIQIGELIAKSPDKQKTKKRLIKREKETNEELQIAVARDGSIYIEPVTRKILNGI